jgi:hypothetical protein
MSSTTGLPGSVTMGASLVNVTNNFKVGVAATGSFTSATGHILTIENGLVLNIMPPAGTIPVNTNYLGNITNQINNLSNSVNAVNPCALIQQLVNEIMPELQIQISGIQLSMSLLLPMITLPSANLGSILTWIESFTAPHIAAYLNYVTQLEQLLAAIATLTSAIATAAARLENCHITVPPIVTVAVAPLP